MLNLSDVVEHVSERRSRTVGLIRLIAVANLILVPPFAVAELLLEPERRPRLVVLAVLIVLQLWALLLLRKGRVTFAAVLDIVALWLLFGVVISISGGAQSPFVLAYLVLILIAAMLLGWRASVAVAAASLAAVLIMLWLGSVELMPKPLLSYDPIPRTLAHSFIFIFGSSLIAYLVHDLQRSLQLTQTSAAALARSKAQLDQAHRIANLGTWEWELASNRVQLSEQAASIFGLPADHVLTDLDTLLRHVPEDDRERLRHALSEAVRDARPLQLEHDLQRPDGTTRFVLEQGEVFAGADGRPERLIGTILDVTERKRLERKLEHLALHDTLTSLPNRRMLENRFAQVQSYRDDRGGALSLLFLDLDRFKLVNDTAGHASGDSLLREVATRLQGVVRGHDLVARLGGDEFAVLLHDADELAAARVAERMLEALRRPITVQGRRFELGASIGITTARQHEDSTFEQLMRQADQAMYQAKEQGGGIRFYDPQADHQLQERVWLEQELRLALEQATHQQASPLTLHYQPIVDPAGGNFVTAEALLRWQHPERGAISPGQFVPLAEQVGLIPFLDRWVIGTAIQQARTGGFAVAVNISPRTLEDHDLVEWLATQVQRSGLPGERLTLELTEQVFADPTATLRIIEAIKELGVRIAVDDFGTGYSSLGYLSRYPLDILKIDRSFLHRLEVDARAEAIASSVVQLAHNLQLTALAEGIETPQQLAWVRSVGCDLAQGFYFARPMPFEALLAWVGRPTNGQRTPSERPRERTQGRGPEANNSGA